MLGFAIMWCELAFAFLVGISCIVLSLYNIRRLATENDVTSLEGLYFLRSQQRADQNERSEGNTSRTESEIGNEEMSESAGNKLKSLENILKCKKIH